MTEKKPMSKQDFVRYILGNPIDEILENQEVVFVGDDEKARSKSLATFTSLRGIIQRGGQIFTPDDNTVLISLMKACVSQKQE